MELAEPNFLVERAQLTPDDERFSEPWALNNAGQAGGAIGSDIGASAAWATTTGSASTVVAVIDSGIDFTHPELRDNRWENRRERGNGRDDDRNGFDDDLHGWDWVADGGVIRDGLGHGIAVAGPVAARQRRRGHFGRDVARVFDESVRARLVGDGRSGLGRRGD